ncbi:MAG: glycosyltransferase family 4 protein [Verrucomicrobia bacterium]|nr:glycosyltransferase family 4 protein [Verrucomicrobiota bacterium]
MNRIGLTHFFTFFSKLGGVETLLKSHLANDGQWGIDSQVFAFFEPKTVAHPRVTGLGLTWRDCVRSARWKYQRRISSLKASVAFYHNFWGIPFIADLDGAARRVALLHSDWPGMEDTLRAQRGLVDGVLCVNEVLRSQVLEGIPGLAPERVAVVPLPIAPPNITPKRRSWRDQPIVCGFSGRVVKEQKRIDLLPQLCRKLDDVGLDYVFEVLGSGPEQSWLEQQFNNNPKVRIHGRKAGDEYWRTLAGWDVIVFMSDYEGLPISLLEALSLGIVPIYPRIRSGGDAYAQKIKEDFLYEPGDFERVARVLSELTKTSDEEIGALRAACQRLAEPHLGDSYIRCYAEFVRQIVAWPRNSPIDLPSRPFYWSDFCPFGLMRRIYYRGFYKRNDRGLNKAVLR